MPLFPEHTKRVAPAELVAPRAFELREEREFTPLLIPDAQEAPEEKIEFEAFTGCTPRSHDSVFQEEKLTMITLKTGTMARSHLYKDGPISIFLI